MSWIPGRRDDAADADDTLDPELETLSEHALNVPAPDLTSFARIRAQVLEQAANQGGGGLWRRLLLGTAGGGGVWAAALGAAAAHKAVVAAVGASLLIGGAVAA